MSERAPKRAAEIEVQIFGIDRANKPFSEKARVLEFSPVEVLVEDVRAVLRPQDIVGIRCGDRKVRFFVTWIGRMGSSQVGQVRLRSLEPMKDLWGPLWSGSLEDFRSPTALNATLQGSEPKWAGQNRRSAVRLPCNGKAQYNLPGSPCAWAKLRDLSLGGCYLETVSTVPKHSELSLDLETDELHLKTFGIVQASNPGFGMGIRFHHMQEPYRLELSLWIARRCRESSR